MVHIARFTGTHAEVTRQFDEWKATHPQVNILAEGSPATRGSMSLESPTWEIVIEYEDEAPR